MHKKPYLEHYVVEIFDVRHELGASTKALKNSARQLSQQLSLNILKEVICPFKDGGLSLIFVLSTSHLSFHYWPEKNYLHIDLLVCQKLQDQENLEKIIEKVFKTCNYIIYKIDYKNHS